MSKERTERAPQRLVADANVFIAAFLRDSTVRRIVTLAGITLLVPEYLFEEVEGHLPELARRAGLDQGEARELYEALRAYFDVVPSELVDHGLGEATRVMEGIDPRDAIYLAAALAIPCDGLWSDDPHLRQQKAVKCWTTKEVVGELERAGFRV